MKEIGSRQLLSRCREVQRLGFEHGVILPGERERRAFSR